MRQNFSKDMLKEIRRTLWQALVETFEVMFQLDVRVLPKSLSPGDDQMVCSTIEMAYGETVVYLSIATHKAVISLICDRLMPNASVHSIELVRDVISEITNIISNQLRTSLNAKYGILYELSLPKDGVVEKLPAGVEGLNIEFTIMPENGLNMHMTYIETSGVMHGVA